MPNTTPFVEAPDAVDKLSLEEQAEIVDILRRRMIEQRRAGLVKDVHDVEQEFAAGGCHPVTPSNLIKEVLS